MATALEESAGSLLHESLNLGDVFGSRYLGEDTKASLLDDKKGGQRGTKAEECSDSDGSGSDDGGGNEQRSEATSKYSRGVRQRRRRAGSGDNPRRQGGTGRPTRRATGQTGTNKPDTPTMSKLYSSSPGHMDSPKKQNDEETASRRTTGRQRRRDPRVQNTPINTSGTDVEKDKPSRAIRRTVSTSADILSSPHRTPRKIRSPTSDMQSERSRRSRSSGRTSSPRRCASPRRVMSPRKQRPDENTSGKGPYKGRSTPTDPESESSRMNARSPDLIVQQQRRTPSPAVEDGSQFPSSKERPVDDEPLFPESQHRSQAALQYIMERHQQSPRSQNEAEDELIEEASRGSQKGGGTLKANVGDDSSENDDDADETEEGDSQQGATVLQFDPTQAGGVFLAKQASTEDSDIHMKNKDGTETVFNIAGMADPIADVLSRAVQPAAPPPMFDFLGDQPDEEQQEHTESAEREAFNDSTKLREVPPVSQAAAAPSPRVGSRPVESGTSGPSDKLQAPKRRTSKGSGKPRPAGSRPGPASSTLTARPAPAKRGVSAAKTMSSRHLPRKSHEAEGGKPHKKLVNDSKNYSQFFKDSKSDDKAAEPAAPQRPAPRPKLRQRARRQAADENVGYSESEAEQAPRPRRMRKKPAPGAERKTKKPQGPPPTNRYRGNNDSFAHSDTEEGRRSKSQQGKGDSFAFSDTEAMGSKRREFKPDFNAGPFPSAPQSAMDVIDGKGKLNNSASGLFADNPDVADLANSPVKPSEKCETDDASEVDTDNEKSGKRGKKSLRIKSIGRYFRKNKGGGAGTDAEQSDGDNASVKSGGSRLFSARRAKQQHFSLLDGSVSSMEDVSLDFDKPR